LIGESQGMKRLAGSLQEFKVQPRAGTCYKFFEIASGGLTFHIDNLIKVDITKEQYNQIKGIKVAQKLPEAVQKVLDASKYKANKDVHNLLLAVDSAYMKA
jgi:hypothetical protein